MRYPHGWNTLGILIAVLFVAAGQLLWLPDPLGGAGAYWIDWIDRLVYAGALAPLCLFVYAVAGIRRLLRDRREFRAAAVLILFAIKLVSAFASVCTIVLLAAGRREWLWIALALAAAIVLGLVDRIASDWEKRRRFGKSAFAFAAASAAAFAILLWPTSYMVTYPGLTVDMNAYAEVEGGTAAGEIMGVLVFERPAFPVDWIYARLFPVYDFAKRLPADPPLGEQLQIVRAMRVNADQLGSAVAFHKAGFGKGVTSHGALVVGLAPASPAAGVLLAGDVIVRINGFAVDTAADLIGRLRDSRPGDIVDLTVEREGKRVSLALAAGRHPDDPDRAALGIQVSDEVRLDLPRDVRFRSYLMHEGGPSHGAMLALAILDQLTPGGITGGNVVAGTGTIRADGSIGPIGGIRQKAFTVERAGADVFFVPAEQAEEARKTAKDMPVVPVETLDDVLQWLRQHPKSGN